MTADLASRVRDLLQGQDVREVRMFRGRAFMVDGAMAVSAGADDDLLVRVDPDRYPDLCERPGACVAVMGRREMGPGWLRVDAEHVRSSADLEPWIAEGLHGARRSIT